MSTYTWKIEAVNIDQCTMEVSFQRDGQEPIVLNLPMPRDGEDLGTFVDGYAPRSMWIPATITVEVGATGTGTVDLESTEAASEVPNTVGSWQEEYLRAVIYSVLEEIREQTA